MGLAKQAMIEAEERGWEAPDKYVCADCVDDDYLKGVIEANANSHTCDYCEREGDAEIAARAEDVMSSVMGALRHYYAEPGGAGVPYESAEGGYLVEPTDTADALMSLPFECNDEFFEDIVAAITPFNDAWVKAAQGHWASEHENKVLIYGWRRFADHVKHRQRYFFTTTEREFGQDIEPSRLMSALGSVVSELELIQRVPAGIRLFRVRLRSTTDVWPLDVGNLGAPPAKKMTAGRMNPPGIRYLYLALEEPTAVAEIVRGPPCSFAVAEFRAKRDITILNLTDLPMLPSIFHYERLREREFLLFLEHFVEAISRPVVKDGSEHVEYVPTQIVCEYFASVFRSEGNSLDGILYPSAVRPGGRNLVLFPHYNDDEDSPFTHAALYGAKQVVVDDWPTLNELL